MRVIIINNDQISHGLEGIKVANTRISYIDGKKGQLIYRGYEIEDLVTHCQYEDIVALICCQEAPLGTHNLHYQLAKKREISSELKRILDNLPYDITCLNALKTVVSAMSTENGVPTVEQGIDIIAKIPTIIAYYQNSRSKKPKIHPIVSLTHTENYLYMLLGYVPDKTIVRALDTYFMVIADHGMNASTFTARVVTSTESDLFSAINAAICSLKGRLHGGAILETAKMFDMIHSIDRIEPWVIEQLKTKQRIMGFGHRVYKTYDPRAEIIKKMVMTIASDHPKLPFFLHLEKTIIEAFKSKKLLYPNIEFWAAALFKILDLPLEIYIPTFVVGRISGWVAHILEQSQDNRLVRPGSNYIGSKSKKIQSYHKKIAI